MNLEAEYILYYLGMMERFQVYHLTAAIKDVVEEESDEWQGFVAKIKHNQRNETAKIYDRIMNETAKIIKMTNNKIENEIEKTNNKIENMESKIDSLGENM